MPKPKSKANAKSKAKSNIEITKEPVEAIQKMKKNQ